MRELFFLASSKASPLGYLSLAPVSKALLKQPLWDTPGVVKANN